MLRDSVILVGFMGAGKSVCGRRLARRLGRRFVETDEIIVTREGRSIPEIFRLAGEQRFRELEAEVLEELAARSGDVIATGGGFPCRDGHMERLRTLGTVIWLDADLDELLARARRTGGRPMIAQRSTEEIAALYRQRRPYYDRAHLRIDTTGLSLDRAVARLMVGLEQRDGARL